MANRNLDLAALKTDLRMVSREDSVYLEWWELDALIQRAEEFANLRDALRVQEREHIRQLRRRDAEIEVARDALLKIKRAYPEETLSAAGRIASAALDRLYLIPVVQRERLEPITEDAPAPDASARSES